MSTSPTNKNVSEKGKLSSGDGSATQEIEAVEMAAGTPSTAVAAASAAGARGGKRLGPNGAEKPSEENENDVVGYTVSWKAERHISRKEYNDLVRFTGLSPSLDGTISRHQFEMAVREASRRKERKLRVLGSEVVDTEAKDVDSRAVIARVNKDYVLERCNRNTEQMDKLFQAVNAAYKEMRDVVHTTVVAEIIKRYVDRGLSGFPLRDHGGVYFVSSKLDEKMFAIIDFLQGERVGHLTYFGVGGTEHEQTVLSDEIERGLTKWLADLREAFEEANLESGHARSGLKRRVRRMREELSEMGELFGFARDVVEEKDSQVRTLMRDIIRGQENIAGADLFSEEVEAGLLGPTGDKSES